MLTHDRFERSQFVGAIAFGFFVFFYLLPTLQENSCASPQHGVRVEQENTSAENHGDQPDASAVPKNQNSNTQNNAAQHPSNHYWPTALFCGEMKLTDLVLGFFTYALAVIGWFTLRSNEKNLEATERAYVFLGYDPPDFDSGQVTFTFVMTNVGRMPGVVKEVGYAFLKRANLPSRREDVDWAWEKIPYDGIIPSGERKPIIKDLKSPLGGDHIFVAHIRYQDIFTKRMHASRMGMHIYPTNPENQRTARAGGEAWNEWD
jgi:hypothetical protein